MTARGDIADRGAGPRRESALATVGLVWLHQTDGDCFLVTISGPQFDDAVPVGAAKALSTAAQERGVACRPRTSSSDGAGRCSRVLVLYPSAEQRISAEYAAEHCVRFAVERGGDGSHGLWTSGVRCGRPQRAGKTLHQRIVPPERGKPSKIGVGCLQDQAAFDRQRCQMRVRRQIAGRANMFDQVR